MQLLLVLLGLEGFGPHGAHQTDRVLVSLVGAHETAVELSDRDNLLG